MGGPERVVTAAGAQDQAKKVQDALDNQKAFTDALNGANGIGNQTSVFNQLADVAAGRGPNPAQTMLNQSTGANAAQTAAQIGSTRGISQNVGQAARTAANAGANIQQNAVGQGAALQANQSLGALGQMGEIAGQQVGEQAAGANALTGANQTAYQQLLDQIKSQNQTAAGLQENINTGNTAQGINNSNNLYDAGTGLLNNAGAGASLLGGQKAVAPPPPMGAQAGTQAMVPGAGLAAGGQVAAPVSGPRSSLGRAIGMAKGGVVKAQVSPGEIYLSPGKAKAVAAGKASPMSGQRIPGAAKVKGDSYANDTVRKNLQEGGVVIKRTMAGDPDKATAFVRAVMGRGRYA